MIMGINLVFAFCFNFKKEKSILETMQGRHIKAGNGRKRKRAVWPPLPHLLGDTRRRERGGGIWRVGIYEERL